MTEVSANSVLDAFFGSSPRALKFSVAILDDAASRLTDLVSRATGWDVEYSAFFPDNLPEQGSLLQHNLLLINAGIDSHPPGRRLHQVLASTGGKSITSRRRFSPIKTEPSAGRTERSAATASWPTA